MWLYGKFSRSEKGYIFRKIVSVILDNILSYQGLRFRQSKRKDYKFSFIPLIYLQIIWYECNVSATKPLLNMYVVASNGAVCLIFGLCRHMYIFSSQGY